MDRRKYRQHAYYLMYLIRCVLKNRVPAQEKLDKMDLGELYGVASAHLLTSIAAEALRSAGINDELFEEAANNAIRKIIILDFERGMVLAELDKAGIWHMPLKGAVMQAYYPRFGLREMNDIDILCDETKMNEVRRVMEKCGFTAESVGESHQDIYSKPPVSNFEMHSRLFEPRHKSELYSYYSAVKSRLVRDGDSGCGYHFSREDFYVFMIAHEYKHLMGAGTGLRSLLDIYIYTERFGGELDWDGIRHELDVLGLAEYEKKSRELARKVFGGEPPDEEQRERLDLYIFSGAMGVAGNRVQSVLGGRTGMSDKAKYVLGRVSFSEQTLKEFHPFFYRHRLFRPVLYLGKIISKLRTSRRQVISEFRQLMKY